MYGHDKNNAKVVQMQNKKSNCEQSDHCDLEQVTLKSHFESRALLDHLIEIWYHSLSWGDSIRKIFHDNLCDARGVVVALTEVLAQSVFGNPSRLALMSAPE